VKPWVHLDTAPIPGGGELQLWQHTTTFAIRVGRDELMSSLTNGSEAALAELALARLVQEETPHVLIGGLGMGYTAAAVLPLLPAQATVTVAELIPAVVTWNRGPLAHLARRPLDDARVAIHLGDVADCIRSSKHRYAAILLDVDNGPHAMTTDSNRWLYGNAGLAAIRRALIPGGILGVWSARADESFTDRLSKAGFAPECLRIPAHGTRGPKHVIWVAQAPQ